MNKTSVSILVFGTYLVGMGAGLAFMPNAVLGILGLPPSNDVWPRVVGVLALVVAFYYIRAARADVREFAQWTVPARAGVFVFFTGFAVAGLVGPVMILLGSVDLLGAIWTSRTLRADR